MITFDGETALLPFRFERLSAQLAAAAPGCKLLGCHHVYYVDTGADPSIDRQRLAQVLRGSTSNSEATLWVVPRLGTISPWSSKATEILHACNLAVQRVEHGLAFTLDNAPQPSGSAWQAILAVLHDPMTQSVLLAPATRDQLFEPGPPAPLEMIALGDDPQATLMQANQRLGLALADDEIEYLVDQYATLGRSPSDAELMMFAQANSEHCRHKVFNASFSIDGQPQDKSLFAMIRNTHALAPQHTLSAYSDNAAVIAGSTGQRFFADAHSDVYGAVGEMIDFAIKVETHNHPTAISPFAGASTGSGGEIRDEGATGRGGKPKAGLAGFTVSALRIPGLPRPWEQERPLADRFASAFEIMRDGPVGTAAFNNEFGRPCLGGYFRSFEQETTTAGEYRGYDKPIMIAGGLANLRHGHVHKNALQPGDAVIVLGGPAMLIGLGGGAASSVSGDEDTGKADLAAVQRHNPEMQRRCQQVIDACWALGDDNPLVSIHDVGAGGLSNAIPELLNDAGVGGRIDLRAIPSADPQLSPMQIWSNEAQERYVMAVTQDDLQTFRELCERERCPYAVVGEVTAERHLLLEDPLLGDRPIDLPMEVLFGNTPRMHRDAQSAQPRVEVVPDLDGIKLDEAIDRVLRHPAVGSKSFLLTIGDRNVGGLSARDPMVGPWQVPVADCAVTLIDFEGYAGEAMAMGERTPLALLSPAASARMAVGEALTNLMSAPVKLDEVRLSANWMAAVGHEGEDAALYEAVKAIGMELCPELGISIPVGKDSLSMDVQWSHDGAQQRVVSPVSLVVTGFARVDDVRTALTPELRDDQGETSLWLLDLGAAQERLGGSILMETFGRHGGAPPDLDDAERMRAFCALVNEASAQDLLLAYHDRSDGGVLVSVIEMAFAGRSGIELQLDGWAGGTLPALFSEELGAVVQIRDADAGAFATLLASHGLDGHAHRIGRPITARKIRVLQGDDKLAQWTTRDLLAAWSETSHAMQRRRDNPAMADAELEWRLDESDPGVSPKLTFDPGEDVAAPFIASGARPRVAILREQGINGHVEMAAAWTRAGFEAVDVHMTDLRAGRHDLVDFHGVAACGGFSYGDVLGAGRGWASSILYNNMLRDQFEALFNDPRKFAIGACNGCQMLSQLREIIPGAQHWPTFTRNASEQYEARLVTIEVMDSPSILFQGMQGSRLPVIVAHGEGRAHFDSAAQQDAVQACLRFVDNHGVATERFPLNSSGTPRGQTGFTAADGRATILMPHPERMVRTVQMSWKPRRWGDDSPWLRMFRNARVWLE